MRSLIPIFFLSLFLRISFIFTSHYPEYVKKVSNLKGDSAGYEEIAINILNGEGYKLGGNFTTRRTPLYPLFVALLYSLFGRNHFIIRIIQSFLGALTCILLYFLCLEIFKGKSGEKIGLIAAFICSIDYSMLSISAYLITETLLIFLLILGFLLLLKESFFSGVVFALGSLCSPKLFGFSLFIPFFIYKKGFKCFIIFLIGFILTLSPWIIRNYNINKSFIPVTIHFGEQIWKGNRERRPVEIKAGGQDFVYGDEIYPKEVRNLSPKDRDKYLMKLGIEYILSHKKEFLFNSFFKFINIWRPYYKDGLWISKIGMTTCYILFLPFALFGIILSLKNLRKFLLFYILIFYWNIIHIITVGGIRYRYPLMPILFIFSAYAILHIFTIITNKKSVLNDTFF